MSVRAASLADVLVPPLVASVIAVEGVAHSGDLRPVPTDLAASIKDRRLFEQLARLAEAYPSVVLVVEGESVHMHQAAWQGAPRAPPDPGRHPDRRGRAPSTITTVGSRPKEQ